MKKTLLVIDDKVKLCETLTQTFEQLGYQTFYAINSSDARITNHKTAYIPSLFFYIFLDVENRMVVGAEYSLVLQ